MTDICDTYPVGLLNVNDVTLRTDSLRLTIIESDSGGKTERSLSYDEGLDNYREDGGG